MKNKILCLSLFLFTSLSLFSQGGSIGNGGNALTGYVFACKEPVKISGSYAIVYSGDAITNCQFTIVSKGTGVGLWTGTLYQWNDVVSYVVNCTVGSSQVFSPKFQVLAQGIANNFLLKPNINVAVGFNGTLIPCLLNFQVLCN